MWIITGFSVYDDPVTVGIGLGLFVVGEPVYYCFLALSKTQTMSRIMGTKRFSLLISSMNYNSRKCFL